MPLNNIQIIDADTNFEGRFKALVKNIKQSLIEINQQGNITFVSKYFLNFTDYNAEDLINKNIREFINSDDISYFDLLVENEDIKKIRFRVKNNTYICFEFSSSLFYLKKDKNILLVIDKVKETDIKDLIEGKKFLKTVFDYIPAIINVINAKTGSYEYTNRAITDMLGHNPEVVSKDGGYKLIIDTLHPDEVETRKNYNDDFKKIDDNPNNFFVQESEYRVRNIITNNYIWLKSYAVLLERDEEGLNERFLNISLDITDRKEAEQKLKQTNQELERIITFLNELTSNLSHDLRAPINSCYSILNVLSMVSEIEENIDKSVIKEITTKIKKSLTKINESIMICLDREMLNVGKLVLKNDKVDVKQALEDTFFLYQEIVNNRNIKLDFYLPQEKIFIAGDRIRFEHVLSNLIGNALKYTDTFVEVTSLVKDNKVTIKVTNDGMSIDSEIKERIFDRYTSQQQNKIGGTGLGLYICKQYIDMMDGYIWFESANGLISFYVSINLIKD